MVGEQERYIYLKGRQIKASYHKQIVEAYQGNPFIEAIPPRLNQDQLYQMLDSAPRFFWRSKSAGSGRALRTYSTNQAGILEAINNSFREISKYIQHDKNWISISKPIKRHLPKRNGNRFR